MKSSKIAVIGGIYRDFQIFVEEIPKENEAKVVEKINMNTGGKVVNASIIMSRLGNEVFYLAKVGNDDSGKEAIEFLKKEGVNSNYILQDKDENTGQVIFMTNKNGKSGFAVYHGANNKLTKSEVVSFVSEISQKKAQYIYTSTSLPLDILQAVLENAEKVQIPVFLDVPNKQKEIDPAMFSKLEFLAPNQFEASLLTGIKIENELDAVGVASWLREKGANNILITMGDKGVVIFMKGWSEPKHFEVEAKKEVDGAAAGDVFRGAFLSEVLKGKEIDEAVRFSSRLAGLTASRKGAYASIPTREEIAKI